LRVSLLRPVDTVSAWDYDPDYLRYASNRKNASLTPYPPTVFFWYRQSSHYPANSSDDYAVFLFNRDTLEPGMVTAVLDSEGRLVEFHARPPTLTRSNTRAPALDWFRLFAAAGLDPARFESVQPQWTPNAPFEARAAWTGSAESDSHEELRVEAASYQGRPVSFRVLGPWGRASQPPQFSFGTLSLPMFVLFVLALPLAAGLLAWKNTRTARGDRRGAFRLALFASACALLGNLAGLHHVPTEAEFVLLFSTLRYAVTVGCLGWIFYMAFEPLIRRQSPARLISWNRLLAGRFRDPMVGGHVLVGVTVAVLTWCATHALGSLPFLATSAPKLPYSAASGFSLWVWHAIVGGPGGLGFALVLSLVSKLVRRAWLALLLFVAIMALILAPGYGTPSFIAIARPAGRPGMHHSLCSGWPPLSPLRCLASLLRSRADDRGRRANLCRKILTPLPAC